MDTRRLLLDEVAAIIAGTLCGAKYGLKIRLPHATVMTFLFAKQLTFREKFKTIAKLSGEHATNLAAFVAIYKSMLAGLKLLRRCELRSSTGVMGKLCRLIVNGSLRSKIQSNQCSPPGQPELPHHSFLAGALGGYIVWGRYSSVNYQMILYLASRILVGCIKLAREKGVKPFSWSGASFDNAYPLAAAGIWGTVLYLFEEHPHVLHPSLRRSMDEIYRYTLGRLSG